MKKSTKKLIAKGFAARVQPALKRAAKVARKTARMHGTPLYAALLDNAMDVCSAVVNAGGRLSAEEERDPAAAAALQDVFERDADLRLTYSGVPKSR